MAQTEIHSWPLPERTARPDVPQDLKNLADVLDRQVPFVCTQDTRPAPIAGLIIYETDTLRTWIGTGTRFNILGAESRSFTPQWVGWQALGTGFTSYGEYSIAAGGMVTVRMRLRSGRGASLGTGRISVHGFPVRTAAINLQQFGTCSLLHNGPSGLLRTGILATAGNANSAEIFVAQGATPVSPPGGLGVPWTEGSEIHATLTYASALGYSVLP